ncbi:MAG TPA: winged helix DNA-binding protein [Kiloniellales bacterium]|nr:winged helix DNA-binding protein [Kiloniellales bacterium]
MDSEHLRAGSGNPTRGGDSDFNVLTYRFPESALGALDEVEGTAVGQTSSWSEFLELALEAAEQGRPLLLLAPDQKEGGSKASEGDRLDRLAVMLVRQVLKQVRGSTKDSGGAAAVARSTAGERGERSTVLANLLNQAEIRRRLQPDLSPYDESWDFMMALAQGGLQGRVPSVSGLCRQVGCPLATGQRRVERLEELGLIQRSQDPDNLRRHRVELTERGRNLVDAYVDSLGSGAN